MFRAKDRQVLGIIDHNLGQYLVRLATDRITHAKKLKEDEAIWQEEIQRNARCEVKLDALLKAQDQDREAISAWIGGLQIDIDQLFRLLAVKEKENGLKKSSSVRRKR